jgi:hypothetical protein
MNRGNSGGNSGDIVFNYVPVKAGLNPTSIGSRIPRTPVKSRQRGRGLRPRASSCSARRRDVCSTGRGCWPVSGRAGSTGRPVPAAAVHHRTYGGGDFGDITYLASVKAARNPVSIGREDRFGFGRSQAVQVRRAAVWMEVLSERFSESLSNSGSSS